MSEQSFKTLYFTASDDKQACDALIALERRYSHTKDISQADAIIALGGDGFLLKTLHQNLNRQKPIYGINFGSVGFLMNTMPKDDLVEKINTAEHHILHPLEMVATDMEGKTYHRLAFNEISLLRQRHQAAKIRVLIDSIVRMPELVCDGIMVATPAGSTAYNLSAHGTILPLGANLLALTPISAFRPRRWRGALLPEGAKVEFIINECDKRPVSAVADDQEIRNIIDVTVKQRRDISLTLLFDRDHTLEERIIQEQFIS